MLRVVTGALVAVCAATGTSIAEQLKAPVDKVYETYRSNAHGEIELLFDLQQINDQAWTIAQDHYVMPLALDGVRSIEWQIENGQPLAFNGKPEALGRIELLGPEGQVVVIEDFQLIFHGKHNIDIIQRDSHPVFTIAAHDMDFFLNTNDMTLDVRSDIYWHPAAYELGIDTSAGPVGQFVMKAPMELSDYDRPVDGKSVQGTVETGGGCGSADVIVGDLPSVFYWGQASENNTTYRAYSIATTSCNIGSVNLNWFAEPSSNHPVIGQNIYRYHDMKFEQLGASWVKHGFCALQGSICTPPSCQAACGGCCTVLGPNCSDPYSSSRNGEFGNLGPRIQINPSTGIHPGSHQSASGNTTLRGRIRIPSAELGLSGAKYYGEGQYVALDDASAECNNNNASWREAIFSGTSFVFTGSTVRQEPAIFAWVDEDPLAKVGTVDVENHGRFHVGYRASDNGDGTWHYEYAVHNLNSSDPLGGFSVPVPDDVNLTNIEYRPVYSHSGENLSNIDWSVEQAGGAITWSTLDYDSSAGIALAVRWGTMFNFRFDADAPPTFAPATGTIYMTGTPDTFTTSVSVPAGANACTDTADCADGDNNGIRDDGCIFYACSGVSCQETDVHFADFGGPFGDCAPDGTADGNDRFHALNCFADSDPNGGPGSSYPCADDAPFGYNIDAVGEFGSCGPDGTCDGNDAFAALAAFEGTTACACPLDGPAPEVPRDGPAIVGTADVSLRASTKALHAGQTFTVDVYFDNALEDVRGYQLHLGVSGGHTGQLELIDISMRPEAILEGHNSWKAFNVDTAQMVAGMDRQGVATPANGYLATYTYRVSDDATGAFTVELLADDADGSARTFLFASHDNKIVAESTPITLQVDNRRARTR